MKASHIFHVDDIVSIKETILGVNLYKHDPNRLFMLAGHGSPGEVMVVVDIENQSKGYVWVYHNRLDVVAVDVNSIELVPNRESNQ